jgi:hypothetical protein
MAKLLFDSSSDFFDFVPLLVQLGTANPELLDDDESAEFYIRIDRKIRQELRKYYLAHPELRPQTKRFVKGIETGEQIIISIKADSEPPTVKYLKENWIPVSETVKKYMGEKLNG